MYKQNFLLDRVVFSVKSSWMSFGGKALEPGEKAILWAHLHANLSQVPSPLGIRYTFK